MGIGKRIKEARENLGLTQNELAELVGITGSAITNYEKETSHPKEPIMYKLLETLKVDANYLFQDVVSFKYEFKADYKEQDLIEKYRSLDTFGKETVSITLNREYQRVATIQVQAEELTALRHEALKIIDIQPHIDDKSRMVEYFRSASAGDGIFIMGNEGTEKVMIPDVPGASKADYAIKISGTSMKPDYNDGEVALVSQTAELHYGDVGIFIINGNAYIKEYRKEELFSRNPENPNVTISEYDNIVCMGKVVGKVNEEEMVKL